MSSFDFALTYVLKHEGGWANHPADKGGPTNYGITLATAKRHGIVTAAELRAITPAQVATIYKIDYWRFDGIEDQRVATKLFDMCVNMGLSTAVSITQEMLNIHGVGLQIDGRYGPKTEAAINSRESGMMLIELCLVSEKFYERIVAKNPSQGVFLKGWVRRAREIPNA